MLNHHGGYIPTSIYIPFNSQWLELPVNCETHHAKKHHDVWPIFLAVAATLSGPDGGVEGWQ